jgi:acyl-CoA synthetase (NDP forming)
VHDSGFERAHVADVAAAAGVPFAPLSEATRKRLAEVLDPGLEPGNPLDVWGTGRDPEALFTEALSALADDPAVGAVALAVDLVPEYDGDDSYRTALLAAAAKTGKPLTVLASIPAAIDQEAASSLRAAGIPVLESTRTGLLALGHLLARVMSPGAEPPPHECAIDAAIAASMAHSFTSPAGLTAAYAGLSARLGPRVTVTEMAKPGPELILGMARDPALGPLVVVGAGGVYAEFLAERSVALPPLTREGAAAMLARLRVTETLSGLRGTPQPTWTR